MHFRLEAEISALGRSMNQLKTQIHPVYHIQRAEQAQLQVRGPPPTVTAARR